MLFLTAWTLLLPEKSIYWATKSPPCHESMDDCHFQVLVRTYGALIDDESLSNSHMTTVQSYKTVGNWFDKLEVFKRVLCEDQQTEL